MVRVQALILCAALLAAPILAHGAINAADSPAESVAAGTAAAAAADPCAAVACGDHGACVDGGCMGVDGWAGAEPVAIQSMYFWQGSEQRRHQVRCPRAPHQHARRRRV